MNLKAINQINAWLKDESFLNWVHQSNTADIAKWERYFVLHPEERPLAETTKDIVKGIAFRSIPLYEVEEKRVLTKINERLESISKIDRTSQKRPIWVALAACFALLLGSIGLYLYLNSAQPIVFATNFGETKEIVLPDSSTVILNANSELSYQLKYTRKIHLKGEAFFNVQKSDIPFKVFTSDLTVQVLGTTFNVNSRLNQTRVFLEKGAVQLAIPFSDSPQDSIIQMSPGDLITYSKENQVLVNTKEKDNTNTSWKTGTMVFKNMLLPEIAAHIQEIYGIEIRLASEQLKIRSMTIALPNKNLDIALKSLEEVLDTKVKLIEERTYLISQ